MSVVLSALLACGTQTTGGGPSAVSASAPSSVPESEQQFAPTPFSADQIREAMPIGRVIEWRLTMGSTNQRTAETTWTVIGADASGMTLRTEPGGEESTTAWTGLRDHARFPAPSTEVTAGVVIETSLGALNTTRYVVTKPGSLERYWFAPSLPGPPIRHEVEKNGTRTFHMEQTARRGPEGTQ